MKDRRRKLLIEGYQYRFGMASLLALIILINSVLILDYLANGPLRQPGWVQAVAVAVVEAAVLAVALYLIMRATHRLAGPILSLKRTAAALGEGDLSIVFTFRKGDYLHDVADVLNGSIGKLRARVSAVKALTAQLRQEVSGQERAAELVARIEEELHSLKTAEVPHETGPQESGTPSE
jgi:methyl-accepting chemotaxis protein